jgi:hypothetical protein
MSIANVALSNTFNELRTTTNTVITEVNKLSDGTAVLVVDSITANTFTGVSSDLNISANTGTDVVSLVTESLRIVGTNGISTSIASSSNTINVNLDTSGITAGAYGSASKVPQLVIDAQGRVTSASNVNVAGVSAFNYHTGNANFQIATADGGSFTASIGQDLGTTANVTFQHLTVSGNLTVTGTTTTISANNLVVEDNLIYLNDASSNTNVDLGFAGNYNDGVYRHAGLFRDADDGVWKFFDRYTLEPDASANLDTSHVSFRFAALKAGDVTSNGTFYGPLTGVAAVATVANTVTLTSDDSTNATRYLTFVDATSGNEDVRTDSGLTYNPSTGLITATQFSGSGATLTSIPNSATTASASNGASTIVARDAAGAFAAGAVTINEFSSAQSISKVLNVQSGSYGVWVNPRFSAGSYNPLTSANSAGLIFTNSASQSGNGIFLLAPWSDIAAGIRISQSSHTANTTIASNTLLLAATTTVDGALTATSVSAATLTGVAAVATVSNTATLTADNTTNATNYLTFVNAATGNQALRTDIGLSFNPSTNTLTTTTFSGAFSGSGAALTSIPNSATTASASNGASTIVARSAAGGIGIGFFDETVTALTLSGGNTAVDWNLGAVWNITLTANSTIYFTNPPSSNRARTVTLFITNSGASQKSLTVTGARYTDGVVPVLSSAASAVDAISFTTIDGGLNYYGSFILAALA